MPSPAHALLALAIPRVRGAGEVVDPELTRREIVAAQDQRARRTSASAPGPSRTPRRCRVEEVLGHPFPVHAVLPAAAVGREAPTRTVLYLHGGGYVDGADALHWRYAAALARAAGVRVVLPEYALAPRSTWRDAHDPLVALADALVADSPDGLVVAGDSAGGGLALAVAQRLRDGPGPGAAGLLLISPWLDLSGETPGTEAAAREDPWLRLSRLRLFGSWWAGDTDPADPRVSPLHGDLAGLPPTLVQCGTRDLLVPQSRSLVLRAREAGVRVAYDERPGLIHDWPILPLPEARSALRDAVALARPQPPVELALRVAGFAQLDTLTAYRLWQLRERVFVVEQQCAYPELDGRDHEPGTRHLWVADAGDRPVGCLRVLEEPGGELRVGRVAVDVEHRGRGIAERLVREVLTRAGGRAVVLDAQAHLEGWYTRLGFLVTGPEFLDDGIPHVPMARRP